jgi:type IV secretory pathway VirD2 relaxase
VLEREWGQTDHGGNLVSEVYTEPVAVATANATANIPNELRRRPQWVVAEAQRITALTDRREPSTPGKGYGLSRPPTCVHNNPRARFRQYGRVTPPNAGGCGLWKS